MSDFFLGAIRAFAFGRVPRGWMPCQGQTLLVNQNQALFAIIGTMYGGDGRTTFNLPDLRGQAPLCFGPGYPQGAAGGSATHALIDKEIPTHTHQALASAQPASQNALPDSGPGTEGRGLRPGRSAGTGFTCSHQP